MQNITLFQFFHWYYPNDGSLWKHCMEEADALQQLGITYVWLPPPYKSALGMAEPGYAVYDLFDLGEFDQKGTVPTKYGTKDEYLQCIKELHNRGIKVLADVVLNHRMGADDTELVKVKQVEAENRNHIMEQEEVIEVYTKFTFPGRGQKYSNFIWDYQCFTGVSVTDNEGTRIYTILNEYGTDWEDVLDTEFGNPDYLMGCDAEFRNEHVREELKWWGRWFLETTGVDGFRLDAVKHVSHRFMKEWMAHLKAVSNKDLFFLAEYVTNDAELLLNWNKAVDEQCQLFDVLLHHNFYEASHQRSEYDLRQIFDKSLLKMHPERAITFVDSHDTQPFQLMESFVDWWFKPLAYAIILLQEHGIPCVFYPSIYGAVYEEVQDGVNQRVELVPVPAIREMMRVRRHLAFGAQRDYFNDARHVGWVRTGVPEQEYSGCAVVLSNGGAAHLEMEMGNAHANAEFADVTGNRAETVTTDEHGKARFTAHGASVSVWIRKEALPLIQL